MSYSNTPSTTVSIAMKVNLGNYQSADVFVSLNQIPWSATVAEIEQAIDGPVVVAAEHIAKRVKERIREIRGDGEGRGEHDAA